MQTIVMLMGTSGGGKSGIAGAIASGAAHLFDTSLPPEIFTSRVVNSLGKASGEIVRANRNKQSVLPAVKEAIGKADFLLMEAWHASRAILDECGKNYRLIHVHLFAPPWLLERRLYLRYHRRNMLEKYERVRTELYRGTDMVAYAYGENCLPGIPPILVDTRDWPIREIDADEAREIVKVVEPSEPVLGDIASQYQKSLHINGQWYGATSGPRFEFERKRLDALLPTDMTDMTMLDIGASEGGFCFEALNRGALYCQAVEIRPDWVALIRRLRDAAQAPIGTVLLDIAKQELPALQIVEDPVRYDLATVLNVLHHIRPAAQMEAVLNKILAACNSIVIEGPFCEGLEPVPAGAGKYPSAMCIPDVWLGAVGGEHGFRIDSIEASTMDAPNRRVWKLSRRAS